ncbi:MAG: hypothetical protein L3J79_02695 [Candidatus Marinimicrobia bacterium]|nr:hypothetical protein [Candidatus Neomarinimicrobiota bacterium]
MFTVGGVIDVTWLFDTAHDFSWKGLFMDAGLRRVEVVARAGRQSDARNFMRFSALQGSVLEGRVFEDDFQVASISTAKLLGLAAQGSASLLTLDGNNIDLLETLDLAENVRQDIVNAVNQGLVVTLPKTEQRYYDWSGIGYLKENPVSGEAGYMLSGMIAGASTAAKEWAQIFIKEVLDSPFGAESNRDPLAAALITKISVTDYQMQAVGEELVEPLYVLVTDINGRPVRGAEVTFKVVSGGGGFKDGQNKAITGIDGIAEIRAVLGVSTSSFVDPQTQEAIAVATVYKRAKNTDKYVAQMGVNSFSATVESHFGTIDMAQTLTAYGRPGPAEKLIKILGDGFVGLVNTSLGSILVGVVDRYGNPVANEKVTFEVVKELVDGEEPDGITDFRSLRFFDGDECGIDNPVFDDCGLKSKAEVEVESHRIGAVVNTFFGNTMNTEYQLQATLANYDADLNPDGQVTLVQKTAGNLQAGEYLPPQLFINKLVDVNKKGDPVAAAKVDSQYSKPLTASLIMISNDYTMGPEEVCQEQTDPSQTYPCWRIIGSPVVKTKKVSDGTVKFKAIQGGGTAQCGSSVEADADGWVNCQDQTSIDAVEDGLYRAKFTTGPDALLNWIEAKGEVGITVPKVYFEDPLTGDARETGYRTDTLPMQEITLKSGQKAVFSQSSGELRPKSATSVTFGVYGIKLDGGVAKDYLLLNSVGKIAQSNDANLKINSEKVAFNYTISPPAIGVDPAYEAYSAQIDLFMDGNWFGFIVGDALSGAGVAEIDYGNQWQLGKQYTAEVVLNRGHDGLEIHSDEFPLKLLLADLDVDSDNNAGWNSDGTHSLPARNLLEDQAEALAGAAGKVVRANLLDIDADGVPGFADGIDKFDNQGTNASAPFVPLILEVAGDIKLEQVTVSFNYAASDPDAIIRTGDQSAGYSYEPAPGALRLWSKDGGQSRSVTSISAGGDFIAAGQEYTISDLGKNPDQGYWLFWLEGVRSTMDPEQGQISIDVKLSGNLIASDKVQTTVRSLALVPDYNHDRKIDEEDRKRALAGDTYYFWINDDDDSGETGGTDIPGDTGVFGKLDWDNKNIDGVRDLVDFFPLYLDIHELLQLFDPARYVYKLSNQDGALNFAYTHLDYGLEGNVGDYLTDVATARNYGNKQVYTVTQAGVSLTKDFLLFAQEDEEKGVLLFEGSKKTAEPLVLSIYDGAGKQVFRQSLNISLDGVEQMFRHKNLIQAIGDPDAPPLENADVGNSETTGGEIDRIGQPSNYPDAECSNEYVIWVHGFNVDGQQVRGWHSEIFKRLYWSGSKARFVGVSWYGFERSPIDYHSNVVHAFETAETIGAQLKNMVADSPVTFLAHSLGNILVSSYLNDHYNKPDQALNVKNYFLLNAAVALEAYLGDYEQYGAGDNLNLPFGSTNTMVHSKWSDYERRFGGSEWYQHFKDVLVDGEQDKRYYLTWRNRFGDLPTDTINTISFYSTGEDVLATYEADGPRLFNDLLAGDFGRNSWVVQEKWKGRWPFNHWGGTTLMGWGFNQEDYQEWDDWDMETEVDIDDTRQLTPTEVSAQVSNNATLRTEPFFRKPTDRGDFLDSMLLNPEKVGSDYAATHRDRLLAFGLPALTTPAGGWGGEDIKKKTYMRYYNMDENKNDWPAIRGDLKDWFHSDIKVVAFPFTHEVIKKIIPEGRLQ